MQAGAGSGARPGGGVTHLPLLPRSDGARPTRARPVPPARCCGTCLQRSLWALPPSVFGNRRARAKRNSVGVFNLVS